MSPYLIHETYLPTSFSVTSLAIEKVPSRNKTWLSSTSLHISWDCISVHLWTSNDIFGDQVSGSNYYFSNAVISWCNYLTPVISWDLDGHFLWFLLTIKYCGIIEFHDRLTKKFQLLWHHCTCGWPSIVMCYSTPCTLMSILGCRIYTGLAIEVFLIKAYLHLPRHLPHEGSLPGYKSH